MKKNLALGLTLLLIILIAGTLILLKPQTVENPIDSSGASAISSLQDKCTPDSGDAITSSGKKTDKKRKNEAKATLERTNGKLTRITAAYKGANTEMKGVFGSEIKKVLKERHTALLEAIDSGDNISALVAVSSVGDQRQTLKEIGSDCLEKEVELEGTIVQGHWHYEDIGAMSEKQEIFMLNDNRGNNYRLVASEYSLHNDMIGKSVKVKGYLAADRLVADPKRVDSIQLASKGFLSTDKAEAFQNDAQGAIPTLIMAVKGPASYTPGAVNFNDIASNLNSHIIEGSTGKASVVSTVAMGGWISLPFDPCSPGSNNTIESAIDIVDPSIDFTQFKRVVWLRQGPSCFSSGMAMYPATSVQTDDGIVYLYNAHVNGGGVTSPRIYIHEYEHTLGISHASSFGCTSATAPAGTPQPVPGCSLQEYGSFYSVMGYARALVDAVHYDRVWGTSSDVLEVTAPGTYTILPRESTSTGHKALKVRYGSNSYLYAEYRQPIGVWDSTLSNVDAYQGALVHMTSYPTLGQSPYSVVLDPTPSGINSGSSSVIAVGQTLTTPVTGASFNVVSKSSNGLTISVNPGTPDTINPTGSITSPANNSTVSGPVTINVSASDNKGVAFVQFLSTLGYNIGTDYSAPFTATWDMSSLANGSYDIYARIIDSAGNQTLTGNITVNKGSSPADTIPPSLSLVSPANNSTVSGIVTVTVSATDNVGVTEVKLIDFDDNLYGTDSTAPYTFSVNTTQLANGSHPFEILAWDAAGNWQTAYFSLNINNTNPVDITPPAASVTFPAGGATLTGITTINATASDNIGVDHVDFYRGTSLIGADATAPYSIPWDTSSVANGSYTLTARAYDAAGNQGISTGVPVSVNNSTTPPADTIAPAVSVTAPQNGATISGSATLSAIATDNVGITKVEFYRGTTLITSDTTAPYAVTWNTTGVSNGSYSLTAKAFDAANNTTTSSAITVNVNNQALVACNDGVDNDADGNIDYPTDPGCSSATDTDEYNAPVGDTTAPVVTITSPTNSVLPNKGNVTISATASDASGINTIQIMFDGILKKQCVATTSCSYNLKMNQVSSGVHTITVNAYDASQNQNIGTATKTVTR